MENGDNLPVDWRGGPFFSEFTYKIIKYSFKEVKHPKYTKLITLVQFTPCINLDSIDVAISFNLASIPVLLY